VTMGLVRLMFPDLEARARLQVPRALERVGVDEQGWTGLAQAAIDSIFRDSLAIDMRDGSMVRWVSPRWGKLQGVFRAGLPSEEAPPGTRPWPSAKPHPGTPSRIVQLIYRLLKGNPDNASDRERASEVLDALSGLITATAAKDSGRGA